LRFYFIQYLLDEIRTYFEQNPDSYHARSACPLQTPSYALKSLVVQSRAQLLNSKLKRANPPTESQRLSFEVFLTPPLFFSLTLRQRRSILFGLHPIFFAKRKNQTNLGERNFFNSFSVSNNL